MATPINTVFNPLYIGRQTAQGTPQTTGSNFFQLKRVSGNIYTGKEAGKAEWLDGSRYSDAFDYISSIQVTGTVTVQGSPNAIAALTAYAMGTDVITGSGAPYTHTIKAADSIPYLTVVSAIGDAPDRQILEHSDVQISQLTIEGTADNDVLTAEIEFVGLTPGVVKATLPTGFVAADEPLLHYNAEDKFKIAGLNSGNEVNTVNQCSITISNQISPYFGDSVRPVALVPGRGTISVDFTLLLDSDSLALLNNYYYGTPSPSTGAAPTSTVYTSTFEVEYTRGLTTALRSYKVSIPEIVYTIEEYPEIDAGGEPVELACTGEARVASGQNVNTICTVVAKTADNKSYTDGSSPTP